MAESNRSIKWLIDEDTNQEVTASSVLDNPNEAIAMRMREALVLAQKSGIHKYTCFWCHQPLSLRRKAFPLGESWFFAHFPNSGECPIKTNSNPTPVSYAELFRKRFAESHTHKLMMQNIKNVLKLDHKFSNALFKQRIYRPKISSEWRIPDAFANYEGKEVAFDFQLYNTFIDAIADRNAFYRLIGAYLVWLFPYFTVNNQKLCAKDIYFSHKRNIFVFDSEQFYKPNNSIESGIAPREKDTRPPRPQYENYKFAYEESMARGVLCVNCYWQEPSIVNNTIQAEWHHKLVTMDELSFDDKTKVIYYIDAEKLFYDKADEETRRLYDEWNKAKEERWEEIFDNVINGQSESITIDPSKVSKITCYQNELGLWGFKYNGQEIIRRTSKTLCLAIDVC